MLVDNNRKELQEALREAKLEEQELRDFQQDLKRYSQRTKYKDRQAAINSQRRSDMKIKKVKEMVRGLFKNSGLDATMDEDADPDEPTARLLIPPVRGCTRSTLIIVGMCSGRASSGTEVGASRLGQKGCSNYFNGCGRGLWWPRASRRSTVRFLGCFHSGLEWQRQMQSSWRASTTVHHRRMAIAEQFAAFDSPTRRRGLCCRILFWWHLSTFQVTFCCTLWLRTKCMCLNRC